MPRAGSVRFVRDAPVNGPSSSRPAATPAQAIFWGGAGSPAAEAPFSFQDFPLDALLGRSSAEGQALPQPLVPMQVTSCLHEGLRLMVHSWPYLMLIWHSSYLRDEIQQQARMIVLAGMMLLALCLLRQCLGALLASILVLQADTSTRGWIARAHPGPN